LGDPGGVLIVSKSLSAKNNNNTLEVNDLLDYIAQKGAPVFSGNHRREALTQLTNVC
jgi:hypothetical protein